MLEPYRRHLETCKHRDKGSHFTGCTCPIWAYGDLHDAPLRKSLKTRDWKIALRRIDALESGTAVIAEAKPKPSLQTAIKAYLADCASRGLRKSTRVSYANVLEAVHEALGDIAIDKIDTRQLTAFRAQRVVKPGTARKETEKLRSFLSFCIEQGWIKDNPAKSLRMPQDDSPGALPFERREVTKLLAAVRKIDNFNKTSAARARLRARALMTTLLYTGLRISDLAQLRRAQLDERTGYLTIRETQKTKVPVRVKLAEDAITALRALPIEHPDYFFWLGNTESTAELVRSFRRTLARIGRKTGIHVYPHRFRDTFASELLLSGADIRTVSMLLGHTSVKTTEKHYAHFVLAHQKLLDSAVKALDFRQKSS